MRAEGGDHSEAELHIQEKINVLVRDLYAFYPLLIPFVDSNRYEIQECQIYVCACLFANHKTLYNFELLEGGAF